MENLETELAKTVTALVVSETARVEAERLATATQRALDELEATSAAKIKQLEQQLQASQEASNSAVERATKEAQRVKVEGARMHTALSKVQQLFEQEFGCGAGAGVDGTPTVAAEAASAAIQPVMSSQVEQVAAANQDEPSIGASATDVHDDVNEPAAEEAKPTEEAIHHSSSGATRLSAVLDEGSTGFGHEPTARLGPTSEGQGMVADDQVQPLE